LSVELLNALFNGLSNQIQGTLFKFYNDRNAVINEILDLSRNTWNSQENLSHFITDKFSPIAPPFPINNEQDQTKLAKLMDVLIVDAITIMENEPRSFQEEIHTILILTKQTLCQRTSYITINTLIEDKLLQLQRLFKNKTQKILYKVITSNTQAFALENIINAAFDFLCRIETCLQGEETIIRSDPDSPAEERKTKILSI
jgi:hypothetical protein